MGSEMVVDDKLSSEIASQSFKPLFNYFHLDSETEAQMALPVRTKDRTWYRRDAGMIQKQIGDLAAITVNAGNVGEDEKSASRNFGPQATLIHP
jgi:hypothetical protein